MLVVLRVVAGPYAGRNFEFRERDTFVVGRGDAAHFRLPKKDPYFSRTHFLIDLNPPLCRLIDLNSANGTFVNDCQIEAVQLHHGDRIKAGDTIFDVHIEEELPAGSHSALRDAGSKSFGNEAAILFAVESAAVAKRPFPIRGKKAEPPSKPAITPQDNSLGVADVGQPPMSNRGSEPLPAFLSTVVVPPGAFAAADDPAGCASLPEGWRKLARNLPQPIPDYLLIDLLGSGGMGVVYRAVRQSDQSVFAIKMIQPAVSGSTDDYDRFLREASILKSLDHTHIVRCFDQGAVGELLYFVMEYVPGWDAKKLVERDGPLSTERAIRIGCQLLDALSHAHDRGYIHRDVKPANLLIDSTAGRDFAKLSDFGLARIYHSSQLSGLTELGTIGGTVQFMPPEQITNYRAAPPESDQYAAAATLYYLLTGRHVHDFPKSVAAQLGLILNSDPVSIASRGRELPPALCQAIHRGLQREPRARHVSARAFHDALRELN